MENPTNKVCPLAPLPPDFREVFAPCQTTKCAWYDEKFKRCCLCSIAVKPKG